MALQGSLRDFSVLEILQLLGSQRKTGSLTMEWNTERAVVFLNEGLIISTRNPGLTRDDPLLAFLLQIHRLSDEQYRGLLTIQKESNRDLEDLLLTGRYIEAAELAGFVERQILNDLMRLVRWENGTYRFDPNNRWPRSPLVKLGVEPSLIEASRRVDEQKRFVSVFKDPYQLLGVRDLPDPNQALSQEERELFGIVDGQHTVDEIVQTASLCEYEAYEALHRMLEAKWIEVTGHRDPGQSAAPPPPAARVPAGPRRPVLWELVVAGMTVALFAGLRLAARQVTLEVPLEPANDVYAAAQIRELRVALDLYRREHGAYPGRFEELVAGGWISADQARINGYVLRYRPPDARGAYEIDLQLDR
ncbi:MAG TPA: DUF4388 domain-containing protein [Candidatus Eisenbacteria bacterium]|jgi:hypothetical protein